MSIKKIKKIRAAQVRVFKIKNRRGLAGLCMDHLTEGSSKPQVLARMRLLRNKQGNIKWVHATTKEPPNDDDGL